jgi:hypothetical protein
MAKSKKKVVVRGRARNGSGRNNGYGQDQSGWTLERRIADVHRFVRRDFVPVDPGSAGVGVGYALSFSLDQLPNYTDFTNLFDNYVIEAVDITLIPGINAVQIAYCPDFDDAVAPTGIADLLERQCCQVSVVSTLSYQQIKRRIVPRVPVESGSTVGPMLMPVGTPLDTADSSIVHFGYKFWFDPVNPGTTAPYTGWRFMIAYHLRFMSAK